MGLPVATSPGSSPGRSGPRCGHRGRQTCLRLRSVYRGPVFACPLQTAQLASPSKEEKEMASSGTRATRVDWRTRWVAAPRTSYTTETKPFFLTSEFVLYVLYEMGLGIAASTSPGIDARLFWILTTIATGVYMLSRGIAKAGSRSRAYDPRDDIDVGRDNA